MTELSTRQLRVLSHPTRLAFLRRLRTNGAATARGLGREFDLDSGAASYHLRRLHDGGLVTEDPRRGSRRERWWRAVDQVSQFDPAAHDDDETARQYIRAVVLSKADEMQRLVDSLATEPREWLLPTMFFDRSLDLDVSQMTSLKRDLLAVVDRYSSQPASAAGSRSIAVHLQLHPTTE